MTLLFLLAQPHHRAGMPPGEPKSKNDPGQRHRPYQREGRNRMMFPKPGSQVAGNQRADQKKQDAAGQNGNAETFHRSAFAGVRVFLRPSRQPRKPNKNPSAGPQNANHHGGETRARGCRATFGGGRDGRRLGGRGERDRQRREHAEREWSSRIRPRQRAFHEGDHFLVQ